MLSKNKELITDYKRMIYTDAKEEIVTDFHLPSDQAVALVRTLFLANNLSAIAEGIAAGVGLTRAQSSVLHILHGVYPNPASIHFIKERIVIEKSDVSRLVKRLEKANFVKCSVNHSDRRAVEIIITKKGLDAVDELYNHSTEYLGSLTLLSKEETKQFNDILLKLLKPITNESRYGLSISRNIKAPGNSAEVNPDLTQ